MASVTRPRYHRITLRRLTPTRSCDLDPMASAMRVRQRPVRQSLAALLAKRVALHECVDELKDLTAFGRRELLDLFEPAPQPDVLG